MAHTFNLNTLKVKTGGSSLWVQGYPTWVTYKKMLLELSETALKYS